MKKFVIKALIFSCPILIYFGYNAYTILVLPLDAYTFRVWEAVKVYEKTAVLSGPFYPNVHIEKKELGDLPGRDKYLLYKDVVWFTDKYGFRKNETNKKKHEVVIIGDSLTVGSGLTQSDMLSEKLEKALGVSVYPFAPYTDMNRFLEEKRFNENPPDLIIIEAAEKLVLSLPEIIPDDQKVKKEEPIWTVLYKKLNLSDPLLGKIAILEDRLKKKAFVNYLSARLSEFPNKIITNFFGKIQINKSDKDIAVIKQPIVARPDLNGGNKLGMVFYPYPEDYFLDWKEHEVVRTAKTLKAYQKILAQRGTKLIFMPVPNKENIYWNLIKDGKKMNNLKRLIQTARNEGVLTIDLTDNYDSLYKNETNKLLYHLDDSHWTPYAVDVAIEELL